MACKTPDELIALADSEDVSLSLDELDEVSGGSEWHDICTDDVNPGVA